MGRGHKIQLQTCEKKVVVLECVDAEKLWSGERLEQRENPCFLETDEEDPCVYTKPANP